MIMKVFVKRRQRSKKCTCVVKDVGVRERGRGLIRRTLSCTHVCHDSGTGIHHGSFHTKTFAVIDACTSLSSAQRRVKVSVDKSIVHLYVMGNH